VRPRDHRSPVRSHRHRIDRAAVPSSTPDWPLARSQTRTVLSYDPETTVRPSGVTATELTGDRALPARATGRWPGPKPGPCCPPTPRPPFAVSSHRHRIDRVAVPFQHARLVAGQVPNSDCVVVRPRDHGSPIRSDRHRSYPAACPSSTRESPLARSQTGPCYPTTPKPPFARQESPPGN